MLNYTLFHDSFFLLERRILPNSVMPVLLWVYKTSIPFLFPASSLPSSPRADEIAVLSSFFLLPPAADRSTPALPQLSDSNHGRYLLNCGYTKNSYCIKSWFNCSTYCNKKGVNSFSSTRSGNVVFSSSSASWFNCLIHWAGLNLRHRHWIRTKIKTRPSKAQSPSCRN